MSAATALPTLVINPTEFARQTIKPEYFRGSGFLGLTAWVGMQLSPGQYSSNYVDVDVEPSSFFDHTREIAVTDRTVFLGHSLTKIEISYYGDGGLLVPVMRAEREISRGSPLNRSPEHQTFTTQPEHDNTLGLSAIARTLLLAKHADLTAGPNK